MNFGNPERPEIMGQFVGAMPGMAEACRGARLPGRLGQRLALQRDQRRRPFRRRPPSAASASSRTSPALPTSRLKREGDLLVVDRPRGRPPRPVALSAAFVTGKLEGAPPPVDLADEIKAGRLVRALIREGKVVSRARRHATAACWSPSPRWRSPATSASQLFPYERQAPGPRHLVRRGPGPLLVAVDPAPRRGDLERAPPAGTARPHRRPRRRRRSGAERRSPAAPRRAAHRPRRLAAQLHEPRVVRAAGHSSPIGVTPVTWGRHPVNGGSITRVVIPSTRGRHPVKP